MLPCTVSNQGKLIPGQCAYSQPCPWKAAAQGEAPHCSRDKGGGEGGGREELPRTSFPITSVLLGQGRWGWRCEAEPGESWCFDLSLFLTVPIYFHWIKPQNASLLCPWQQLLSHVPILTLTQLLHPGFVLESWRGEGVREHWGGRVPLHN